MTSLVVYRYLRSAHLDRNLPEAEVVFCERLYDLDRSVDLPPRFTHVPKVLGILRCCLRTRASVVEVNEPLFWSGLRVAVVAVAAVRLGAFVARRKPPRLVAYCLGNLSVRDAVVGTNMAARLKRSVYARLSGWLVNHLDFVVYGTEQSRRTYQRQYRRLPPSSLVWDLPKAVSSESTKPAELNCLFVGALDARKGILQLIDTWPWVRAIEPQARLIIAGDGAMRKHIESQVSGDPSVALLGSVQRNQLWSHYDRSRVLVLLSQRVDGWREQVGLPICEALSMGLEVVATTETGIAEWLQDHKHRVLDDQCEAAQVASAIVDALRSGRPRQEVRDSLPQEEGRIVAARLMHSGGSVT